MCLNESDIRFQNNVFSLCRYADILNILSGQTFGNWQLLLLKCSDPVSALSF